MKFINASVKPIDLPRYLPLLLRVNHLLVISMDELFFHPISIPKYAALKSETPAKPLSQCRDRFLNLSVDRPSGLSLHVLYQIQIAELE